ncbi:hypothetical protein [Burkholderia cenocepacia]|uniref:Uncharacterized protein n=1 Tax=Burkholderia cenocepacia TaxID=95486 RepID=A0ABD4UJT8_9BURK|nr:hypothetical protein [Burkholderia cenocepacia]MCW3699256.1 hypothetical protein [Burkholderia cenocepacia]MCW3704598.1 hypothetical protein [Burkholderia cenocepacia]MCW3714575.1 hypothetical protein [Burkholderia cenocepacia]MCW3720582.1 hypothetical protein [Burkholderia cenocepacia]MCW3720628.1 hypothetical protein [Burkholderia cenocepacia]
MQTLKPRARQLSAFTWCVTNRNGISAFGPTLDGVLAAYFRCVLHTMTEPRR